MIPPITNKSGNNIILKKEFIASLNGKYTELLFNFTNGITKTVVINPKSTITNVNISGNPIVGNTLNATCVGSPEKVNYDVNYQWQVSVNGTSWFDITNANSNTYTISNNEYDLFIRVKVTSNNQYGNVVYPLEKCSISTKHKVVILGDVDLNGTVNTNDATLIQKYLSGEVNFTGAQKMLIATNYNYENPNIISATRVQKYAADYTAYFDDNFVPQYSYYRDSYERRMQRTFNFTICPKSSDGMYTLDNGYFDTEFLQEYYIRFYKEI